MTLSEDPSPPGLSFPVCQMRVDPKRQAAAMTGAGRAHAGPLPPAARARAASRGRGAFRLPARSHWRRPGLGMRGASRTLGPPRAWAQGWRPARATWCGRGRQLTWRGQRAEDLAAAVMAAAATRAGSDWRWLPGTGRWRPHVTHIRALRAGAGRGERRSRLAGQLVWRRGAPATP